MSEPIRTLPVLGIPVACVSYASAWEAICTMSPDRAHAVCAANTHIVSQARSEPGFGRVMRAFDLLLPDGMPLVWALNRQGAGLRDRVYGPYFMKYALEQSGPGHRHFFFGGRPETLEKLVAQARVLNPGIQIAGTYSPPFRAWDEADRAEHIRVIRESGADFIWVALGGERQERWIHEHLGAFERGVFLAVGDAFELIAGNRPFAPEWMQRSGVTWLYRLWQEPRRLWPRYLKYNSLFVYYSLRGLAGFSHPQPEWPCRRIAFIGSRGVPARYSGFETVVEHLGRELAGRGYEVTVYNRLNYYDTYADEHAGMEIVWLPTVASKNLDTPVHTCLSMLHAWMRGYDLVYLCGVGNAPLSFLLRRCGGVRLVVNVDGADFRRKKWGWMARWWLRRSEAWAVRVADAVIADNPVVVRHYEESLGYTPEHIGYGTVERGPVAEADRLAALDLRPRGYFLYVSRLTPENEAVEAIRAYRHFRERAGGEQIPELAIVGEEGYESAYGDLLREEAGEGVRFLGTQFGEAYRQLSSHALAFLMPATIEATRLVLVDQLGLGAAILYHRCAASEWVLGDAGWGYGEAGVPAAEALSGLMEDCLRKPEALAALRRRALERARERYHWDRVADVYERLFFRMVHGEEPAGAGV